MISVEALTAELMAERGIRDSDTRAAVTAAVSAIAEDPECYDHGSGLLTRRGVDAVRVASAQRLAEAQRVARRRRTIVTVGVAVVAVLVGIVIGFTATGPTDPAAASEHGLTLTPLGCGTYPAVLAGAHVTVADMFCTERRVVTRLCDTGHEPLFGPGGTTTPRESQASWQDASGDLAATIVFDLTTPNASTVVQCANGSTIAVPAADWHQITAPGTVIPDVFEPSTTTAPPPPVTSFQPVVADPAACENTVVTVLREVVTGQVSEAVGRSRLPSVIQPGDLHDSVVGVHTYMTEDHFSREDAVLEAAGALEYPCTQ